MGRVLLIIPAYNEADNIKNVMEELNEVCPQYDYLIINDGSSDDTQMICENEGYHYINMPVNVGLSGVFRTGMRYADRYGYDFALQYDGDGQHDPRYIKDMLRKMEAEKQDIVIGSRYLEHKPPFSMRNLGSWIIRVLIKITTGQTIMDPTSGMRLYSRQMIHLFGNNINLPPEPDTMAYLIRCGYHINEVPVKMRERLGGISYLNFGNSVRYMINMCISIIFVQCFRGKNKK